MHLPILLSLHICEDRPNSVILCVDMAMSILDNRIGIRAIDEDGKYILGMCECVEGLGIKVMFRLRGVQVMLFM